MHDPRLETAALIDLHPTQMTVGLREVNAKRQQWKAVGHRARYLGRHVVPVVTGTHNRHYLLDHHHLCRALWEEGVPEVGITVVADLSHLGRDEFWAFMEHRGWLHPYDANGRRRTAKHIPSRLEDLKDDPYRSLAGATRLAGGFAKDTTPFSEFLWATHFRRHIRPRRVRDAFAAALDDALALARSASTAHLPGWCGPHPR
jgi:hypothetical protein